MKYSYLETRPRRVNKSFIICRKYSTRVEVLDRDKRSSLLKVTAFEVFSFEPMTISVQISRWKNKWNKQVNFPHGTTTFSIMTFSIMTFSIMTFSIMTLSIMTLSIMTFSIIAVYIMTFSMITLSITGSGLPDADQLIFCTI
jgi:hypothetical protein